MTKKLFTFLTLICLSVFLSAQSIEDKLVDRLKEYAQINTQSESDVDTVPSTRKQCGLAALLVDELRLMGLPEENMELDASDTGHCIVYATIKGNVKTAPTVFISAHLDTYPLEPMEGHPVVVIHDYEGGDIVINEEHPELTLTQDKDEFLKDAVGGKVITSDGNTILGGDDKAGMAVVMTLAETFIQNPSIPHGDIRIIFTPDEEVGNSTTYLTKESIGADFGLVIDSHGFGRLLVGNFNAANFTFDVRGLAGFDAYNGMPSPYRVASNFTANFPKELAAYRTSGLEGYVDHHDLGKVNESANQVVVKGRLRSFTLEELNEYKEMVAAWAKATADDAISDYKKEKHNMKYITVINGVADGEYNEGDLAIIFTMKDSYYNAKYVLDRYPTNFRLIQNAFNAAGVTMMPEQGRGGSDAGDITYLGIPTYNLFDGSHNEHSKNEWVSSKQMLASYNVAYNYLTAMGGQDKNRMLQEGEELNETITPIKSLDFLIKSIYKKLTGRYGNSLSNQ